MNEITGESESICGGADNILVLDCANISPEKLAGVTSIGEFFAILAESQAKEKAVLPCGCRALRRDGVIFAREWCDDHAPTMTSTSYYECESCEKKFHFRFMYSFHKWFNKCSKKEG